MESFMEVWSIICDYCKTKITDVAYKSWISRIEPLDIDLDKSRVILLVPNDFHRNTLTRCYMGLINEAFEAVFGTKFDIQLKIPEEIEEKENETQEQTSEDTEYDYTFDTFIVGSSNKFAHAAALSVATNPARSYNPLFLYGNSGLGKTHLLYAIGNDIKKNYPDKEILYVKGDEFTNELIAAIRFSKTLEFRQKYRQVDVLLVDDVQFIGGKESTQEEFFHTFNALYESHKQIVLTSDRPPKEIKTLEDRLRTRFESGLLADIQPPDIETRIAIIKRKAELLNITLSNEVCEYIASKIKTNIRQLEGVVKKIRAQYLLSGKKPTITTAKEVISDIINNDVPPEVNVQKIIDEVSRTYGITPEQIRSPKRGAANVNKPRQIAIYIVRQLTDLSTIAIGEEFGKRHYSSILYAIQHVEEEMSRNPSVKETITDLIKNISSI